MLEGERKSTIGLSVDDAFSVWLDLFRWIAAMAVVLTHMNYILFVKVLSLPPEARTLPHMALALISGWGRPAVMIFFVISGFLVGGGSLRKLRRNGRIDAIDYFAARLTRLWIVLIPAFVLTAIVNYVGIEIFGGVAHGVYNREMGITAFSLDPGTLVCNVAFLHTALCSQYGGNGALWTVFNEFWYYVIWVPVMLCLFLPGRISIRLLFAALAALALALLSTLQYIHLDTIQDNLSFYFLYWLIGVVIVLVERPLVRSVGGAFAIWVAAMLAWRFAFSPATLDRYFVAAYLADALVVFSFANLLVAMRMKAGLAKPPLPKLHVGMAAFSFSLYAIHEPLLYCYSAFLEWSVGTGNKMIPTGIISYVYGLIAVLLCTAIAFVFGKVTERHTLTVRRRMVDVLRTGLTVRKAA